MAHVETLLFGLCVGLYAGGWLVLVAALLCRRPRASRLGAGLLVAGFLAHTRLVLADHGPALAGFHQVVTGAWALAGVTLGLGLWRRAFGSLAVAATGVALVLMGYSLTRVPGMRPMEPSLRTPWLYVHVGFAWISFGTFTAAAVAAVVFLVKHARTRRAGRAEDDPRLRSLDELQFRLVTYGFVATAAMIASGSIWARLLWGTYWGWDPVETWALAAWLVYGLYIHLRVVFGWRMRRAAWLALFALIPVLLNFWGVSGLVAGRHLTAVLELWR